MPNALVRLPTLHTLQYPQNALLDFSGVNAGIDTIRQQDNIEDTRQLNEQRLGLDQERLGMERQRFGADEQQRQTKMLAGVLQSIDTEADPAKRTAMMDRVFSNPAITGVLTKHGINPNDREYAVKYMLAQARGFIDPAETQAQLDRSRLRQAQTGLTEAQTAAARAKPAGIIKEGDKPLVAIEPDASGRMTGRQIYTPSTQQDTAKGIYGGLQELHSIPGRYGGDQGSFGSAVGAFQGDPNSWVMGPLARAWGSLTSFGAGMNAAPPAEVRRTIEGASNTLAASLKPLIRKPGEGTWSDRDQAVLNSIVGDLARANGVEQYQRELDNVRQRINANFRLNLPPITDKTFADRVPQQQAQETKEIGGKRYVKINGDWYEP